MEKGRRASIIVILAFLGLPFLTQLALFPLQKLTMFSSPLSGRKSERFVLMHDGRTYAHPAASYMLKRQPDCRLAGEALSTFFHKTGTVSVIKEEIENGDTTRSTLLTCPK